MAKKERDPRGRKTLPKSQIKKRIDAGYKLPDDILLIGGSDQVRNILSSYFDKLVAKAK